MIDLSPEAFRALGYQAVDLIVERLRVYRDSGLGEKTVEAREPFALSAAREVLQETSALRNSLAGGLRST